MASRLRSSARTSSTCIWAYIPRKDGSGLPRRCAWTTTRCGWPVISRLAWIRRKRAEFQGQDRQSRREFVTGESHYFAGRRYRLDVVESTGQTGIRLRDNAWMEMRVRPSADRDAREAMLYSWYRAQLRERIPEMVAKWEPRIGVKVADWRIRRMKTRWGTCNPDACRIWLNSELAKSSVACLEYVVVHEMTHLIERGHNERLRGILDRVMPGWRMRLDELNRAYLADEEWGAATSDPHHDIPAPR